jgi:hypothetical protein
MAWVTPVGQVVPLASNVAPAEATTLIGNARLFPYFIGNGNWL